MTKSEMKVLVAVFVMLASSKNFADSAVSWSNTENYKDIDAAEENQKKFESRLFKSIEKHFNKLTSQLPKEQKLWIKVTDMDLAGRVLPGLTYGAQTPGDIRVIEHHYFPKIKFNYHLSGQDGEVLKSGKVELKDISFSDKFRSQGQLRDPFHYEKNMLETWYNKEFLREVATN